MRTELAGRIELRCKYQLDAKPLALVLHVLLDASEIGIKDGHGKIVILRHIHRTKCLHHDHLWLGLVGQVRRKLVCMVDSDRGYLMPRLGKKDSGLLTVL